jgi:type II secretory pathway pseudopilin PulG
MRPTSATKTCEHAHPRGGAGFTLIESVLALAIAATAVIAILSGMGRALEAERHAREKLQATLLLRTIESAANLPEIESGLLEDGFDGYRLDSSMAEHGDREWRIWQAAAPGPRSEVVALQFSGRD